MAVLDWLQQLLGGGDPEAAGAAQASTAMQPATQPFVNLGRDLTNTLAVQPVTDAFGVFDRVLSGQGFTPEEALNVAALPVGGSAFGGGGGGLGAGIRAFHGSPHSFDRFDLSKIGTGEGAQAYGHGLYFAESEPVARSYRDALTPPKFGDQLGNAADLVKRFGNETDALNALQSALERNPQLQVEIDAIKSGAYKEWKPPGHMYEVDINAKPEDFLNWDKPLAEQSPNVQEAMRSGLTDFNFTKPDSVVQLPNGRWAPTANGQVVGRQDGWPDKSTAQYVLDATSQEAEKNARLTAGDIMRRTYGGQNMEAKSQALKEAGIPGTRYADQGSRFNPAALPDNPIANEAREFLKIANGDSAVALKAFQDSNPISRWGASERDEVRKVIEAAARPQTSNYAIWTPEIMGII